VVSILKTKREVFCFDAVSHGPEPIFAGLLILGMVLWHQIVPALFLFALLFKLIQNGVVFVTELSSLFYRFVTLFELSTIVLRNSLTDP